jgi:hypothetical protein
VNTQVTRWDEDARPEDAWHGRSLDELADLRERVIGAGSTGTFANGLIGWLVAADSNAVSKPARAAYRKILRELGPPPRVGGRGGKRRRTGQRGATSLQFVAGGTAAASVLAIAAQAGPVAASLALAVATPIILEGESSERQTATQRPISLTEVRERREARSSGPALAAAAGF